MELNFDLPSGLDYILEKLIDKRSSLPPNYYGRYTIEIDRDKEVETLKLFNNFLSLFNSEQKISYAHKDINHIYWEEMIKPQYGNIKIDVLIDNTGWDIIDRLIWIKWKYKI